MTKKIRFKKLRLWLVYPVFIAYPFVARMEEAPFAGGMFLMALGLLARFWASGHIRKTRCLATSGPYAFTRNPLYVGNFLLGLGAAVASSNIWIVSYYVASFIFLYLGTIGDEEGVLEEKFGEAYRDYKKSVPVFFPALAPYKKSDKRAFDIRQSFRNGEFIRLCGFLLLALTLYLWRVCVVRKEPLGSQGPALVLFMVFFILLWFNIGIRRWVERRFGVH